MHHVAVLLYNYFVPWHIYSFLQVLSTVWRMIYAYSRTGTPVACSCAACSPHRNSLVKNITISGLLLRWPVSAIRKKNSNFVIMNLCFRNKDLMNLRLWPVNYRKRLHSIVHLSRFYWAYRVYIFFKNMKIILLIHWFIIDWSIDCAC